ncbi:hypothetical protein ACFLYY_00745 [Patescibacteria group bacterium]
MRRLPKKPNERQKLIVEAVKEFFGEMNPEEKKSATRLSLWLMNRRKELVLTEDEVEIGKIVKKNIESNPSSKIDSTEF